MKRKGIVLIAVLTVAGLLSSAMVFAGGGRFAGGPGAHGRHGGRDFGFGILGMLHKAKADLGLSDAQTTEIKSIFGDLHEQNAQYREQLHGGLSSVAATLIQDPNNLSAAQAILDQQTAAERALKANMLTATSKALNVLTADQRAKLLTMLQERQGKRRTPRS